MTEASSTTLCTSQCFKKVADIVALRVDLNDGLGVQKYIFGMAAGASDGTDMVRIVR